MEQLTFLGGYESGDCVPLSVHSVSVVSLMTGGDPEVGDVLRHMAATTNGAQAIKGHLKGLNDRRGAANSTLRPSKQVSGHMFDLVRVSRTKNRLGGVTIFHQEPKSLLTRNYSCSITLVVFPAMKSPSHRLGDLQLRILQSLWDRPDSSVAEVHTELKPERDLAYTTVATMLRKMETRGLVTHREQGRSFLYRALVAAEDVSRSVGRHLVDRLSAGSLTEAVSHLLTSREVSRDELDQLEKLIKEAKRRAQ